MKELTREQVERLLDELDSSMPSDGVAVGDLRKHDAAIRTTIEQQAQELEKVKQGRDGLQRLTASQHDYIRSLNKQLAASQARCQVLEKGFADQTAIRERHEAGFTETIAQLQATLAAQEAVIDGMTQQIQRLTERI